MTANPLKTHKRAAGRCPAALLCFWGRCAWLNAEQTPLLQSAPVTDVALAPADLTQKAKTPQRVACGAFKGKLMLASAYFPTHEYAVSSAMRCLTTGFGMGPGVPTSLWTPANLLFLRTGSWQECSRQVGFEESIYSTRTELLIRVSIGRVGKEFI